MACDLKAFIRQKGGSATTKEIATELLKMPNAPLLVAESLLRSLYTDQSINIENHVWTVKADPADSQVTSDWVLLTLVPASNRHWSGVHAVLMAEMHGTMCGNQHIISRANGLKDQDWFQVFDRIDDRMVVIEGLGNQISIMQSAWRQLLGRVDGAMLISLQQTVQTLIADHPVKTSNDLALVFKADTFEWPDPQTQLNQLIQNAQACLHTLHVETPDLLLPRLTGPRQDIDFSGFAFDRSKIQSLPALPGIYLMKNSEQQVIYVGKAKNLARRLMSYFMPPLDKDEKLDLIHTQLYDFEIEILGSELEALLKEWEAIQSFDPPINRQHRVHPRSHRQAERYARILFLPAKDPDGVQLYFLNPDGGFAGCLYRDRRQWSRVERCVKDVFFVRKDFTEQDRIKGEICWSWLSETKMPVHSLDMKHVVLEKEALRLIQAHINSFRSDTERVIHA